VQVFFFNFMRLAGQPARAAGLCESDHYWPSSSLPWHAPCFFPGPVGRPDGPGPICHSKRKHVSLSHTHFYFYRKNSLSSPYSNPMDIKLLSLPHLYQVSNFCLILIPNSYRVYIGMTKILAPTDI